VGSRGLCRAVISHDSRRFPLAALLVFGLLIGAGCTPLTNAVLIGSLAFDTDGTTLVSISLGQTFLEGSLGVTLDGAAVGGAFQRTASGASGVVSVTPGSAHVLVAEAQFLVNGSVVSYSDSKTFALPTPTPALLTSAPVDGATAVPRTSWVRLEFASAVADAARGGVALACNEGNFLSVSKAIDVHFVGSSVLAVNPVGQLPAAASCALTWYGPGGVEHVGFKTAGNGAPATIRYDRDDLSLTSPFPDDFWTTNDASTTTGMRLAVPVPAREDDVRDVWTALLTDTNPLDGFSPIAHFVLELSDAADPTSVPRTPAESLDPLATVGLFDLTPGSPTHGQRVPFRAEVRDDVTGVGLASKSMLLFPSIPLTPAGRYGLVVTNRALVSPDRPFGPSAFMQAVLATPAPGDTAAVTRARGLADEVLNVVASEAVPPIPRDDVALALRFSIRTTSTIPNDLLAIRADVDANPAPALVITSVENDTVSGSATAAVVKGTFAAPDYRPGSAAAPGTNLVRDASGLPVRQRTRPVPFTLTIPKTTPVRSVPVTMYQHGNPGSQAEVLTTARSYLSAAGFAGIAFTDILNREIAPTGSTEGRIIQQLGATVGNLLTNQKIPDYWVETHAEQIAFLRFLRSLGSLDVAGAVGANGKPAPDGIPDLDVATPQTYVGISEGANNGPGFLPYAPEIKAAALIAGGARLMEVLIHQQSAVILQSLPVLIAQTATPTDMWVALALFQTSFDLQDNHNHAEFIYRHPVSVAGTTRKASILLVEGLNDSLVPNHATESLAYSLGPIPHLLPVQRAVVTLPTVTGPVQANVNAETTAAFFQYVPVGVPGIPPTPGCTVLSATSRVEGHYCAQSAAESLQQRRAFFQSALVGVPVIASPFP